MGNSTKLTSTLAIVFVLLSLHLLALWYIFTYTTTYPLAIDEWLHFVPRSTRFLDGTLTLNQAASMQSLVADVPPAPYLYSWLVTLPNVLLFDWNLRIDSIVNYVLINLNIVLIVYLLVRPQPRLFRWVLIPITALMLAVQQRWNLIVGVQNPIHIQLFFALATFILLAGPHRKLRNLGVAMIVAFVGSFASLIGLLTWIIALPALWFLGYKHWLHFLLWIVGAGVAFFIFTHLPGFSTGGGHYITGASRVSALSNVGNYALFVLTYLGAIFSPGSTANLAVTWALAGLGLIALGFNILYLWQHTEYRVFVVVCCLLVAYGGAYGFMGAVGRFDQFGIRGALVNHYITFSAQFWCGLGGLVVLTMLDLVKRVPRRQALLLINGLLVLMCGIYYVVGAYGTVLETQSHTAVVAQQERCIVGVATGTLPGVDHCEVYAGVVSAEMIRLLYDHRLTGFASNQ